MEANLPVSNDALAVHLLTQFLLWFFIVFGVIGLIVGAGLVFRAGLMERLFSSTNRWISLRRATRWTAVPHDITPVVRRYERTVGVAFILISAYSIYTLTSQTDARRVAMALSLNIRPEFATWLIESVGAILIVGNVIALATGILLAIYPQVVQKIEAYANRWYSFRHASLGVDEMHTGFDTLVLRFPRSAGIAVVVASLVLLLNCIVLLRSIH
jgi:hypothetical protein